MARSSERFLVTAPDNEPQALWAAHHYGARYVLDYLERNPNAPPMGHLLVCSIAKRALELDCNEVVVPSLQEVIAFWSRYGVARILPDIDCPPGIVTYILARDRLELLAGDFNRANRRATTSR